MNRLLIIFAVCSCGVSAQQPPAVSFADFSSMKGISLTGDAAQAGSHIRLTPSTGYAKGAAWAQERQSVRSGFETSFQFQLSNMGGLGGGADGFAFVLQNSGPTAVGAYGAAGGFALGDKGEGALRPGIPNSIAVFFDTFKNQEGKDPSDNYLAICTNGPHGTMSWPPPRLAHVKKLKVRMKDGQPHAVRIVYEPPLLSVYLDNMQTPVLKSPVDLSTVADSEGRAFVGFTASTGSGYENHDVLNWTFTGMRMQVSSDISYSSGSCLEGRNLCTPEQATVEQAGDNQYHVVLPAHLEWGASIPNPGGKMAVVSNPKGIICWDLEARGSEGCNGPGGNGKTAGAGFLKPEAGAGALVQRSHEGQIQFSVNDRGGHAFRDNQGFFEFDVKLQ